MKLAAAFDFDVAGHVPVTEDVEVHVVLLAEFIGELINAGLRDVELRRGGMPPAAVGRPGAGQGEDPARVQAFEQGDAGPVAEYVENELGFRVTAAQGVAVAHTDLAPAQVHHPVRLPGDMHAEFLLEIVAYPPVVIAAEKPDLRAAGQFLKRGEDPHMAARNHIVVVHPKIENVA